MRVRYVGIAALFALVIWVALKAPIPGMMLEPLQPSPAVPTSQNESIGPAPPGQATVGVPNFQQTLADNKQMDLANSYNAITEDPKMHAMRQAILEAAQQADAFPCSAKNRNRLAEAVKDFWDYNRTRVGQPPTETMMVNGHVVDAGGYLNRDASDAAKAAMLAGVVHTTSTGQMLIPDPYAPVGPSLRSASEGGRFVCDKPN
jgi:hypothetical protein